MMWRMLVQSPHIYKSIYAASANLHFLLRFYAAVNHDAHCHFPAPAPWQVTAWSSKSAVMAPLQALRRPCPLALCASECAGSKAAAVREGAESMCQGKGAVRSKWEDQGHWVEKEGVRWWLLAGRSQGVECTQPHVMLADYSMPCFRPEGGHT